MAIDLTDIQVKMIGRSPEQNMSLIYGRYKGPSIIVPNPNKYYTFVYTAKTKGMEYDQHPLIISGSNFSWGFTGMNVHWGSIRRYHWAGASNLIELSEDEFEALRELPLARFKIA